MDRQYVVVCRDDYNSDGSGGEYIAATHRLFTAEEAAKYARSVAPGREARIVRASEYLLLCERWRLP